MLTLAAPAHFFMMREFGQHGLTRYEQEAIACFLAALDHAPPGAVLDVGANVGPYGILASALSKREVWCFEPMPEHVESLRWAAEHNRLSYSIEEIALGAVSERDVTFYVSDQSDCSNSLMSGFRKSSRQLQVSVETLDHWCTERRIAPAVLKLDTEATEPDVIQGGLETISAHRPWVFCEVLSGRTEERLKKLLTPLGYHWFHPKGKPPYEPLSEIVGDRTYKHMMWLFSPDPPRAVYWTSVEKWINALGRCTPVAS